MRSTINEFPLRQPIGAASDLAPLLLGSRPLGWVMIAARRPPQGRYDLPRCSGASSNHSKPWLLRYQMVDHSANFSKVNLKTCHGSYGLEFSAKSRECNAEKLCQCSQQWFAWPIAQDSKYWFKFCAIKVGGSNAMRRHVKA